MDKDLPPPYSEIYTPPSVGFNVASNHISRQPVYTLPPQHPGPAVVLTNVSLPPFAFGPHPQPTTCTSCHQQITTKIISEPSIKTHLMALVLCLFGCIPCCIIPYCLDSCQSRNHYCSHCSSYLGTYNDFPYRSGF